MSYLVSEVTLPKLKVYVATEKFILSGTSNTDTDNTKLVLESVKDGGKIRIEVTYDLFWFSKVILGFFKVHRNLGFIPGLKIKIIKDDVESNHVDTLEYLDTVMLTGNIGAGFDLKDFLLGSDKNKYRVVANGLSYMLETLREDPHRIINYTLNPLYTDFAKRGFLKEVLDDTNGVSEYELVSQ